MKVRDLAAGTLAALLAGGCSTRAPGPAPGCAAPSFAEPRELVEVARMEDSADPCWWLSSGGLFRIGDGHGRSLQGALPAGAPWRQRYAASNPADTDAGAHPQNLLRLVTRARWTDYRQEVRFRILRVNASASPERGEWSGVLFLLRHLDEDNLYYAGLRMDGTAVVKKKRDGRYATLAQQPVYAGAWHRERNPSVLPLERWIGMAGEVASQPDGSVRIALYRRESSGAWRLAVAALDDGREGAPLRAPGHGGLRADFMDVEFADYAARDL